VDKNVLAEILLTTSEAAEVVKTVETAFLFSGFSHIEKTMTNKQSIPTLISKSSIQEQREVF